MRSNCIVHVSATPTHMLRICVNSPCLGDADRVRLRESVNSPQEKAFYPLFLLHMRAQKKKLSKRKRRKKISRSAECDKGSSPLTQPPFEKGGRKLDYVQKGRKNPAFSVCTFLARIDKNVQSRRISVSSPYECTAETDFGERKSEI